MKNNVFKRTAAVGLILVLIISCFAGCKKNEDPGQGTQSSITDTPGTIDTGSTDKPDENITDTGSTDKQGEDIADTGKDSDEGSGETAPVDDADEPGTADKDGVVIPEAGGDDTYDTSGTSYTVAEPRVSKSNDITDVSLRFGDDGTFEFGEESTFYSNDLTLTIEAPEGASVYYTFDGRTPDTDSTVYTGPITMTAHGSNFPEAYTFRAIAVLKDGTVSSTAARTYLAALNLDDRFTTLVFSVSGNPDELTENPDGIFAGRNYEKRGRESEREVYVEAWEGDGTSVISQFAGVRIYGGYSRQNSIKSMKLFARSSYDPDHKNFKFSDFGTLKQDGSDDIIKKYSKLVLRDCGNDFQFNYIRDELSQALCKVAGFDCYEAVLPAVVYLNGEYYGFFWLHENYTDKYFKEKFGDAEGEFAVVEGSEQHKSNDDDPLVDEQVKAYNETYDKLIKLDLTDDANYKLVTDFMDVEDYLNFFAFNIAINNWDWPNNNYKCYKYVEASPEALTADGAVTTPDSEEFDGRWRFLVHDMDYAYGLYDQIQTKASFNTLKTVMNPADNRYAPLFTLLMEREDCRMYFINKTLELLDGALSEETLTATYYTLHGSRETELGYYYSFLAQLSRKGDWSIWSNSGHYSGYEKQILDFARDRKDQCIRQMERQFGEW